MKTPTDDIFQLIQSMSAAEKRYFKIHFSSEKSLVTELFNYLNGMKSYNEEDVKNHFADTTLSKNLKVYKIMLMELLLKSLSSFRYKKSIPSLIRQNIEEVEILIEKNLFHQAYKKIQKTKSICIKQEAFDQLIPIIELEYQFNTFFEIQTPETGIDLLESLSKILHNNISVHEIKYINQLLSGFAGSNHIPSDKPTSVKKFEGQLQEIIKTTQEKDIHNSFKILYYAHSALGHLYQITDEIKKETLHKTNLLNLFKENKNFIESNPKKYWTAIFNYANCCLRAGNKERFELSLKNLKAFTKKHSSFQTKMNSILSMEMAFHRRNKNFDFILDKLEPQFLRSANIDGGKEEEEKSVLFGYINLLMTHLAKGDQTKVQFYLRSFI